MTAAAAAPADPNREGPPFASTDKALDEFNLGPYHSDARDVLADAISQMKTYRDILSVLVWSGRMKDLGLEKEFYKQAGPMFPNLSVGQQKELAHRRIEFSILLAYS